MDIFEKVKDLIADQLDVDDKDSITESSSITDDLGADSLDVVDLVMALEDEFNVEIPEYQVEIIKTVGGYAPRKMSVFNKKDLKIIAKYCTIYSVMCRRI